MTHPRPALLRAPLALTVAAVVLILTAAPFGTSGCDAGLPKLCEALPEGGCPAGRGGSCLDRTCSGLYDCVEGAWVETERCSAVPSGPLDAGMEAAADASCGQVSIDHQGEVSGCSPNLQEPECPAAAAEICEPCATGCSDFFICAMSGWTEVAYCDDTGNIVIVR